MPRGVPKSGINKGWFKKGEGKEKKGIFKKCLICGEKFYVFPSQVNSKRLCSFQCARIYSGKVNTGKKRPKEFREKISKALKGRPHLNMRAEKCRLWTGGIKRHSSGYILIYKPTHPFASKDKYVYEHRLVAEQALGRHLTKEEQIHHINGIKNDNRPENLYLFSSNAKHVGYESLKSKSTLISNL